MAANNDLYNDVLRSYYDTSFLCHHGIKGQKWGIRNYQNSDGTLTSAGKERYRSNAHIYKPRSRDTMQREIASGKIVTVSGGGGEPYYEVEDWEKENLQMEDDIRKYEAIAEDENATPKEREDALRKANILRRNLESKRKAEQAFLSEWVSSQEVWRSLGHGYTMNYNDILKSYYDTSFLCHHGILGMKWGIRRYQNKDGTLTAAGRKRYGRYGLDKEGQSLLKSEGISRNSYKITDREYAMYGKTAAGKEGFLISVMPEDKIADPTKEAKAAIEQVKRLESFLDNNSDSLKEQIAKDLYDSGDAKTYSWTDKLPSREEFVKGLRLAGCNSYSLDDLNCELFFKDDNDVYYEGVILNLGKKGKPQGRAYT